MVLRAHESTTSYFRGHTQLASTLVFKVMVSLPLFSTCEHGGVHGDTRMYSKITARMTITSTTIAATATTEDTKHEHDKHGRAKWQEARA